MISSVSSPAKFGLNTPESSSMQFPQDADHSPAEDALMTRARGASALQMGDGKSNARSSGSATTSSIESADQGHPSSEALSTYHPASSSPRLVRSRLALFRTVPLGNSHDHKGPAVFPSGDVDQSLPRHASAVVSARLALPVGVMSTESSAARDKQPSTSACTVNRPPSEG